MLHLAQVTKNILSGELELQLLAYQKSEFEWKFCKEKYIALNPQSTLNQGILILVELSANGQIIRLKEAKDWILNLIRQYLTNGDITPDFLAGEQTRIEKWRQELTVQSQDLTRIRLEIETRREELQQLEETFNLEKEKLKAQLESEWSVELKNTVVRVTPNSQSQNQQ
jgi:hypothetical protein